MPVCMSLVRTSTVPPSSRCQDQDALDIGLCSSRWLCARIFFRRSVRARKFIKPRCSSSGQIALPLKQAAHMPSPSITAVAGTSMPARRRCAAQKYFSITHLLRGPGRERIGRYQKTIIRSGRTCSRLFITPSDGLSMVVLTLATRKLAGTTECSLSFYQTVNRLTAPAHARLLSLASAHANYYPHIEQESPTLSAGVVATINACMVFPLWLADRATHSTEGSETFRNPSAALKACMPSSFRIWSSLAS
jgi:hypothetical protein